jgi:hypothetical protein
MKHGRLIWGSAAAAALIVLPACGHRFPAGERLLPETYGPPFGSALKANIPEHPHNPADSERHAAADSEKNKTYSSHDTCHAALRAAVLAHGGAEENVVRISSIESMGYYAQGNAIHEHRCTDHVLSYRAWHPAGEGGGHGAGHKAEGNKGH